MTLRRARTCRVKPRKRVDAARTPAHLPSGPHSSSPLSQSQYDLGQGQKKRPEGLPKEPLDPLRDAYWNVIRTPSVKFEV